MPDPRLNPLVEAMLAAYREGCFPMADPDRPAAELDWYSPDPRAVLPLTEAGGFHVPRRLSSRVRSGRFRVTTNLAFPEVIRACAARRTDDDRSWIDPRIIHIYTGLHEAGHAHSIEAWLGGALVGGLYGVHIGGAFFAESKFSRPAEGGTDASKVCLVHLVRHLHRRGFTLLDVQFQNPHIAQFGVLEISRADYLQRLAIAAKARIEWGSWECGV